MTRRSVNDVLADMGLDPADVVRRLWEAGYVIGEAPGLEPKTPPGGRGVGKRPFNSRFAAHPGKRGFDSRFD